MPCKAARTMTMFSPVARQIVTSAIDPRATVRSETGRGSQPSIGGWSGFGGRDERGLARVEVLFDDVDEERTEVGPGDLGRPGRTVGVVL